MIKHVGLYGMLSICKMNSGFIIGKTNTNTGNE